MSLLSFRKLQSLFLLNNVIKGNSIKTYNYYLIFVISFFLNFNSIEAQTVSPIVQNIGGNPGNQSGLKLKYSVGDQVSETFNATNQYSIKTGFLQTSVIQKKIVTKSGINFLADKYVGVATNPVVTAFKLHTKIPVAGQLQYRLLNASASTLLISESIKIDGAVDRLINIVNYPSGIYRLQLFFKPPSGTIQTKTLSIIKL